MNDAGLDEPISNVEEQVQNKYKDDSDTDMDEEEEEKNFLMPAKWWYASTAFPLVAGTFGPMANAFSICALVENWRVKIPKGGTEEHGIDIPDPKWLIAVNAVSLVLALAANMSLLLNMARRLRFSIAQPITILGFWSASVLLIGLLAKASHDFHAPGVRDQALTQAYYYGIFAAALYQIISYLMCVTVWGAFKGHYSREFKLTMAQRTLMLQTIAFLVYLLLGAVVFSKIEGWKFLDAVYWADFTALTIGIGDNYAPSTHLGRSLLFPYAIGGIVVLGLVVGSIRSLVLDRTKVKLASRMTEKTRRRVVKKVTAMAEASGKRHKKPMMTGLDKHTASILAQDPKNKDISEVQRRRAEFEAMRRVQEMAVQERKWISLSISVFAWAFLWTIGAYIFYKAEVNQQWSYFESLYFSYTTLLTIGYGDLQTISNSGKPFFVFWSLLAVPTLTILISNMGDTVVQSIKDLTIWLGEVSVLPSEHGGTIDRLKYGFYKATLGKIQFKTGADSKSDDIDEDADEDMQRFQELNPGLVKMPRRENGRHRHRWRKDVERGNQLATDFEQSEKQEEAEARARGDDVAESDHHYRHLLVTQIRKVWNDSNAAEPKKYSYVEWAYFLRLLGEDENDQSFHRRAPTKSALQDLKDSKKHPSSAEKKEYNESGQQHSFDSEAGEQGQREITKWSWIGPRSPLMGDKDESDWLLEKLFARLEWSLKEHWDEHKREQEGGKQRQQNTRDREVEQMGADARHESRPGSRTLDEGQYQKGIDKATEGESRQRG